MDEGTAPHPDRDGLLDVVVDMLETDGYDAVQLRVVARRARSSLATIYKRYPTRDDLILAALEYWVARHRYAGIAVPPAAGLSLRQGLMSLFRTIFEPWERHPEMLKTYFRVRSSPNGGKLFRFGFDIVAPAGMELLKGVDEEFVVSLEAILANVIYGLLGRFSSGEIAVTEILPVLDRTVYWLTRGYEAPDSDSAEHFPTTPCAPTGR
ncbi:MULTISPECIES: TetR family transcriptional regulator [Mycolicibacterium]|uniref:Transcriptional regulator, TetR family n=2 Tax=Mycolicibacterium gilvum TaxID=1804 RepID=E6TIW1_MYCSR|nr:MULTISPECIES: TetR family transcriptional regulator [Mycolicibacterium]ABP44383.1 transcriptional regulator, TetR family [Mycolicibacterium gilvum PYR-GCK]ADT97984.1 transcriptional regulator, TetR family [Mycolicibacterium gilvum Spyr1]MBV5244266.1 TetR family transcriptional regulator [Mycolicibacterium sp. PAM1]